MALLEAKGISQSYDGKPVIEDINLTVQQGEIVCLIGTSGVGKTTLFQILTGLTGPTQGEVLLDGKNIVGKTGQVSYMLQKDMLLPFKTVIDNVCLPLRIRGVSKKDARETVAPYFSQFGLSGYENNYPNELSGGMRQRAAFMRTYFFGKSVMLLDEPFSALDEMTKEEMYAWYKSISKQLNLTTVFISHSLDEALILSDKVAVMAGQPGKIVETLQVEREAGTEFTESARFLEYKRRLKTYLKSSFQSEMTELSTEKQ